MTSVSIENTNHDLSSMFGLVVQLLCIRVEKLFEIFETVRDIVVNIECQLHE